MSKSIETLEWHTLTNQALEEHQALINNGLKTRNCTLVFGRQKIEVTEDITISLCCGGRGIKIQLKDTYK